MGNQVVGTPADTAQQQRTVDQLKLDGWVLVDPQPVVTDGSMLMQLVTSEGVSHIIIMLNGDRVDARQRLGKNPPVPSAGAPP